MSTYVGIEEKVGSSCAIVFGALMDATVVNGANYWGYGLSKEIGTEAIWQQVLKDVFDGRSLEAKTGSQCSILSVCESRRVQANVTFCTALSKAYTSPVAGKSKQVTDTLVNSLSNQKMRGGIAG